MDYDVELMRDLLFLLEERQRSPRTTIILDVDELADEMKGAPDEVDASLGALLHLGYIDGPGGDTPGYWFFRKLTRKGTQFLEATRRPADWDKMKRYFTDLRAPFRL